MSLALLRQHFFGRRSVGRASAEPKSPERPSETSFCADRDSVLESDVESHRPLSKRNCFTVDARVISDATIGLADGLTVPFALTAGLSTLGNTRVVIFGGLAELIAGAISMGLGGYLGAQSEMASYLETRKQTEELIAMDPRVLSKSLHDVFAPYAVPASTLAALTSHVASSPRPADFVMHFCHCAQAPAAHRALTSAATIAAAYFLGGLLPLVPYFCVGAQDLALALYVSVAVMAVALFAFGYAKTCAVVGWRSWSCLRTGVFGGVQMVLVGGAAAGAAMGLVKAFDRIH